MKSFPLKFHSPIDQCPSRQFQTNKRALITPIVGLLLTFLVSACSTQLHDANPNQHNQTPHESAVQDSSRELPATNDLRNNLRSGELSIGDRRRIREAAHDAERWFETDLDRIRSLRKAYHSHLATAVSAPRDPFVLGDYQYSERSALGAAQSELWRSRQGEPAQLVYSPDFGRDGYPLLLEHFAVCPLDGRVALFGTVGPLKVRCLRTPQPPQDPRTGKVTPPITCEETEQISSAAWNNDCSSIFVTEYENGRALRVVRIPIDSTQPEKVLLEESDPAFSLSLTTSGDGQSLIILAHSLDSTEVWMLDRNIADSSLRPLSARTQGTRVKALRAFNSWFLQSSLPSGATEFRALPNPSDSTPINFGKTSAIKIAADTPVVEALGFHSFIALLVRDKGLPRFAVLTRTGDLQMTDTPSGATNLSFAPVQDFESPQARVRVGTPFERSQICTLSVLRARIECSLPVAIPPSYTYRREEAVSMDGTRVPISILGRSGEVKPSAPILINYGAYGVSLDPEFRPEIATLLDSGATVAFGHIRGGGEFGQSWHHAAVGTNRTRGAEDLSAVAARLYELFRKESVLYTRSAGAVSALLSLELEQDPNSRPLLSGMVLEAPFLDVLSTLDEYSRPSTVREYFEWGNPNIPEVRAFWSSLTHANILEKDRDARAYSSRLPQLLVSIGTADEAVSVPDILRWVSEEKRISSDKRLVLLQLVPGGTHSGATSHVDEGLYAAQRIATLLRFAGVP